MSIYLQYLALKFFLMKLRCDLKKNLCEKHSPLINTTKKTPLITSQFFDFKVVYLKNRLMFFVMASHWENKFENKSRFQ